MDQKMKKFLIYALIVIALLTVVSVVLRVLSAFVMLGVTLACVCFVFKLVKEATNKRRR